MSNRDFCYPGRRRCAPSWSGKHRELGRLDVGHGRLDDDDGAPGGDTTGVTACVGTLAENRDLQPSLGIVLFADAGPEVTHGLPAREVRTSTSLPPRAILPCAGTGPLRQQADGATFCASSVDMGQGLGEWVALYGNC